MSGKFMTLSGIVAGLSALVVAAGMAIYAAVEHLLYPGQSLAAALLGHAWHTVALGTLTYVVVWWVVRRLVETPVRSVDAHLYGVAVGNVAPLELASPVREIGELVAGVNLMVCRMRLASSADGLEAARKQARELRSVAFQIYAKAPEESAQMLEHLARLEDALSHKTRYWED